MTKQGKRSVKEAESILKTASTMERVHREAFPVVAVSVATGENINTIRAIIRGRPFRVPLSGKTAKGHRGLTFWDTLRLVLGRKAMAAGISGPQTQQLVDKLGSALKPAIAKNCPVEILLSESTLTVLLADANADELRALFSQIQEKGECWVLFDLPVEIADLGEKLAAMLERRPYAAPQVVREYRERQREGIRQALLSARTRVPSR